jgi:GT2 family glycosyltransferase
MYDIIIPVYNDINTIECVNRALKNTDYPYNIIIVNDKSTNEEVVSFLYSLCGKENIVLLENHVNSGFAASVNRGMSYSDNDVVLLNSDAFVTKKWLSKMHRCAYSDERIMTVTPLSNSATICSVPNFNQDNEIPDGFTIDTFAEFIETISLKKVITIPSGVGFCMLIKRKAINLFGLFDVETFGKGYAEENDFCLRINEAGHYNVVDDTTFVYHIGKCSHKDKASVLLEKNLRILGKRYPYYHSMVHEFISKNPMRTIYENISLRIKVYSPEKAKVLYLLHNPIDCGHIGGTEFHVKELVDNINDKVFYVLFVKDKNIYLDEFNNGEKNAYVFPMNWHLEVTDFYNKEYREILKSILMAFDIDLIHCQHLIGHTFDIFPLAKELDIPVIFTIHDFYSICSLINLLDQSEVYCEVSNNLDKCSKCIKYYRGYDTKFVKYWRENVYECLEMTTKIIVPTYSAYKNLSKVYKIPEEKIQVIYHGIDTCADKYDTSNGYLIKPFKIAFLGYFNVAKGRNVLKKVVKRYKNIKEVKWHVIGNDIKLRGEVHQENIFFHGTYERKDVKRILMDLEIDLVMILPIWPETFCYTLSEAWSAGIPCIVSKLGALEERVGKEGGGWLIDVDNIEEITNLVARILELPEEYYHKKEEVLKMEIKSIKKNADEYKELYNSLLIQHNDNGSSKEERIVQLLEENKVLKNTLIRLSSNIAVSSGNITADISKYTDQYDLSREKRLYLAIRHKMVSLLIKLGFKNTLKKKLGRMGIAIFKDE